jgi:exosome complex RNA-binding protein Rrp4
MAIDMDPEKALKTGEKWGSVLAKAIFGVTDVLRDGKNMKAAANAKMKQQNEIIVAQNAVIRAKNEAKMKAQQEAAFMKMSHSEREAYKKILKEQRIAATVKKAQDDEMLSVGHLLMIIIGIAGLLAAAWFGAVAYGIVHR